MIARPCSFELLCIQELFANDVGSYTFDEHSTEAEHLVSHESN